MSGRLRRALGTVFFLACLGPFISGCSSLRMPLAADIDRQVVGWPKLSVTTQKLGFFELQASCWKHLTIERLILIPVVTACAVINLEASTCVINSFGEMSDEVREHEESHCKGGAHDNAFQELFDRFESKRKAKAISSAAI